MTDAETVADALYEIARKLEKVDHELGHRLRNVERQLNDIAVALAAIAAVLTALESETRPPADDGGDPLRGEAVLR